MGYEKPGPTRQLEKVGIKFVLLVYSRWNEPMFAGICIANGCSREVAEAIAAELGRVRFRLATVRPLKDRESFIAACKAVGVEVTEVEPR